AIFGLVVESQEDNQVSGSSLVHTPLQFDTSIFKSACLVLAIHAESPVAVQLIGHDDMKLSIERRRCAYAIFISIFDDIDKSITFPMSG
ncbi:hypothetical protein ABZO35_31920, partial [Burkholderia pseudomallei]|uniref:hypothetical protein n=1 Tax=Burkholderia pseudomallei TaxID=28450 RepID=UPI00344B4D6D